MTPRSRLLGALAVLAAQCSGAGEGGRPAWQSRLRTSSIASVARREGFSHWTEQTQGNMIVLPASLMSLLQSAKVGLRQFQLMNPECRDLRLYTGPLEFCAPDGECYLPSWMMKQLRLKEGDLCSVATARYPRGESAKFRPHSSDFLDIPDHYIMLRATLDNFAALTQGSAIRVSDGRRTYMIDVVEVKGKPMPEGVRDDSRGKAIDLALSELILDFEPPKDQQAVKDREAAEKADADADDAPPADAPAPAPAGGAKKGGKSKFKARSGPPMPKFKRRKLEEAAAKQAQAAK